MLVKYLGFEILKDVYKVPLGEGRIKGGLKN
jgi:hypothetical protein